MKEWFIGLTLGLLCITGQAQNPDFTWGISLGASGIDASNSITTDVSNNIYITGYYSDSVDFDPGPGNLTLTSNGVYDVFIQKLNPSGNLLWTKSVGGTSGDYGFCVTVDVSGNVFVTGYFANTVDFDPGVDTFNLSANGSYDVYVLKLNAGGDFIWAKSFGGVANDYGRSITTDASGNVYVTGYYNNTADFDPSGGTYNLTSNGSDDLFVQKLDSLGNFKWAKSMGGVFPDYGLSIVADSLGNVYSCGHYGATVDFDPSGATFDLNSMGSYDAYIQKLDSSGNFIWAKSVGGTSNDRGYAIAIDQMGDIYLTGLYGSTVDFDLGAGVFNLTSKGDDDIFVQKLTSNGDFIWATAMGGTGYDQGNDITTDLSGNVYITGYYADTVDFDPGSGTLNLVSNGSMDVFIQKLDASGDMVWTQSLGDILWDRGQSIAADASGGVYITGNYGDTVDFDGSSNIFNLISQGNGDVFIMKLEECVTTSGIDIITACDSLIWIDGITYYSSNNSATDSLSSSTGCDSIIMLDLTIAISEASVDVHIACDSFTWIDGNTYSSSDSTSTMIFTSSVGCDSVVTLDLTLNSVNTSITSSDSIITALTIGASYQWLDCSNNMSVIPGEIAQSFTASMNGDYAVEITENGCTDTSICTNISGIVGVEVERWLNGVYIFPNPSEGRVTVKINNWINESITIGIIDILGQEVYSLDLSSFIGLNETELDLSEYPAGVYSLHIKTNNNFVASQIIIKE